jgi:trimethylamine--corrinoid protein Co-methyltransferase
MSMARGARTMTATMATEQIDHTTPTRRGRSARQAERLARAMESVPYLTRKLPPVEVLSIDGLEAIEDNADTLLRRSASRSSTTPRRPRSSAPPAPTSRASGSASSAGCAADRPGHRTELFTQVARNRHRSVVIGDPHMVLVPTYGSPFIHNLDEGRRYATIEDFRNFVKLAYTSHVLHHDSGTLCEPVDLPVNKRHFDMVYSHIRYSDRAFMGSVTHPSRAQDSVDMVKIVFGADTSSAST